MKFLKLHILIFLLQIVAFSNSASANEEVYLEAKTGLEHFKAKDYESAYNEFYFLHKEGNVIATHMLGVMSYNGLFLEKNHKNAAGLFYQAAKIDDEENYMAGGYLDSAYYLANSFFLNEESEYYNLYEGWKILVALDIQKHVEGSFRLGIQNLLVLEEADDPQKTLSFAEDAFMNAKNLGKIEASFMLFLVDEENVKRGYKNKITTLNELILASTKPNQSQGDAALKLALLYRKGKLVQSNDMEYIKLLETSVDAGNAQAAKLLGKALFVGMVDDPDYSSARFYYEYAAANGVKGLEIELDRLDRAERKENNLDTFSSPDDWYLDFLIAQSFSSSSGTTYSDNSNDSSYSSNQFFGGASAVGSTITSYNRIGNSIRSSNGTNYRITGNTIRSSDGTRYRITGNTISGSDGSRFRFTGNSIRSSDGTSYRITGNTIRGSNGTVCRSTRSRIRCY